MEGTFGKSSFLCCSGCDTSVLFSPCWTQLPRTTPVWHLVCGFKQKPMANIGQLKPLGEVNKNCPMAHGRRMIEWLNDWMIWIHVFADVIFVSICLLLGMVLVIPYLPCPPKDQSALCCSLWKSELHPLHPEVVTVSKKRKETPVKVTFIGYDKHLGCCKQLGSRK